MTAPKKPIVLKDTMGPALYYRQHPRLGWVQPVGEDGKVVLVEPAVAAMLDVARRMAASQFPKRAVAKEALDERGVQPPPPAPAPASPLPPDQLKLAS